jgi:hypothetical protein
MSDTSCGYWNDESASNWSHLLAEITGNTFMSMDECAWNYLQPYDVIISREDKTVLRNQMSQALLTDLQQYLLYQEYQTGIDVNDNTDIDDDSSDDSVPSLVSIDNDDDSSDDSLPPLINID